MWGVVPRWVVDGVGGGGGGTAVRNALCLVHSCGGRASRGGPLACGCCLRRVQCVTVFLVLLVWSSPRPAAHAPLALYGHWRGWLRQPPPPRRYPPTLSAPHSYSVITTAPSSRPLLPSASSPSTTVAATRSLQFARPSHSPALPSSPTGICSVTLAVKAAATGALSAGRRGRRDRPPRLVPIEDDGNDVAAAASASAGQSSRSAEGGAQAGARRPTTTVAAAARRS